MKVKIIHTSDWQIGKVFRFVDDATMGLLQDARLKVITRLGELAVKHDVRHIVVAGDIYDKEALSPLSVNQPLERMRKFSQVLWHLLPGNHDPHRPNGLWDRILQRDIPDNIHIHTSPEPVIFEEESLALLPAPLQHRQTLDDPTSYMDNLELPDGLVRIGVAHGTVRGFGSDDSEVPNYIAPDRPVRAALSYLALGDWHGQRKINDRCWYSGTPETDAFSVVDGGRALLVEIEDADSIPKVTSLDTGFYEWISLSEQINGRQDIDFLERKLREAEADDDLDRVLVDLKVEGALSLEDLEYFGEKIVDGAAAAFRFLRVDDSRLFPDPTDQDLDQIDQHGFVRTAADKLRREATEGNDTAAAALQRLYVEYKKLEAENQ